MTAALVLRDGGEAALSDSRFTVPGIRCAGCIGTIERELGKTPGVVSSRVNFSAKRVAVRHDGRIHEDELIDLLRRLGFEAQAVIVQPPGADNEEARGLLRALAVAGFGMMNIMLLSVSVWSGAGGVTREMFHWLSALIALPVVAFAGRPFFASALTALLNRRTNMDVPISIGVLLATGMSFYETLTGGEHAYFDSAVMLLFFLLAGRALDAAMRTRTRAGIGALMSRMGRQASVVQADGSTSRIPSDQLEPGMIMLVAAGEALAADGVVVDGHGTIDNSMLTGEGNPVPVSPGDAALAGAINLTALLHIRVVATRDDTVLADIARLMDEAGQGRSRYVRIADRAARLYAPAVHALALAAFLGWSIAGAGWHEALIIAVSVLIITCPCAMGLAVPTAQVVAAGVLVKKGVLIKDGSALERLAEVDIAIFDKTGTLTMGEPRADVSRLDASERSIALALSQASRHPLSRSIAATLASAGVAPAGVTDIKEREGAGLIGSWQGMQVAIRRPENEQSGLATCLHVGDGRKVITFSDPLRSDVAETLEQLATIGLDSRILSGDGRLAVSAIAQQLGIEGDGAATPANKLALLESLKDQGRRPLMVGDGLNDGPALAAAHASLAPGSASDTSQQAADVVFLGPRLMPVARAVHVARATMRVVKQNIGFSVGYNIVAVPLALAGLVTPLVAAIAMSGSSLVVVANSLRLARATR